MRHNLDCSKVGTSSNRTYSAAHRSAFTLVELVVVIVVIGILVAVAAPRAFDTTNTARDETAEASLGVIRDALELYRVEYDTYPPTDTEVAFKAALEPFLRNREFPTCSVGHKNNFVRISTAGKPLQAVGGDSWAYDRYTGEFVINHSSYIGL